jgi:hypothetical protein
MLDTNYYFEREKLYRNSLEHILNSILSDTSESCAFDPPSQIRRLGHAKEFLHRFTKISYDNIDAMTSNLQFLARRKMKFQEEARKRKVATLQQDIIFRECLILKYHTTALDLFYQLTEEEQKKLTTSSVVA